MLGSDRHIAHDEVDIPPSFTDLFIYIIRSSFPYLLISPWTVRGEPSFR